MLLVIMGKLCYFRMNGGVKYVKEIFDLEFLDNGIGILVIDWVK